MIGALEGEGLTTQWNEGARFLAGMAAPEGIPSSAWKNHAAAMDAQWSRYRKATLDPMKAWGAKEIPSSESEVVRYLFSGPDILHALHMFPNGKTYIMGGLEPLGVLPELSRLKGRSITSSLAQIRKTLEESIRLSFFKTKDMRFDLAKSAFPGTIPIMSLFLARSGQDIRGIECFRLLGDGSLESLGTDPSKANAVRIDFGAGKGETRSLTYFRTNVANGEIEKSGFLKHLESQPRGGAYLKAASYLMHKSYFSTVRKHLLDYSNVLVEDDSGIPLRHFSDKEWDLSFYGSYTRPIPLFAEYYQRDLRNAYTGGKPRKLDFGSGYKWRKHDTNLLRAVRVAPPPEPKPVVVVAKATPAPKPPPKPVPQLPPVAGKPTEIPVVAGRRKVKPVTTPVEDAGSAGPVTVTLKLVAKSEVGEPASVQGGRALGVFDYEVVNVHSGSYPHSRIRVAHGVVWNRRLTGAARWEVGRTVAIDLVPLASYQALSRVPRFDTVSANAAAGAVYTPALN